MEEKSKRKRIKAGSLMIVVFALIYIPSLLHWVYGKTIATDILRFGTLEESVNADGIIVRDEEVLKSPFEGKCIADVNEGDKVPANSRVAKVMKDVSVGLLEELRKKDLAVLEAQKKKSENQVFFSEDIAKLDEEIGEKVRLVISAGNHNELENIKKYKGEINTLIQKKASIFGGKSTADTYIDSLISERNNLQNQINANTKEIFTYSAGIISYYIDGYENELTPDSIKDITPKTFESIKSAKPAKALNSINVQVNMPFAKIIKNSESHIVVSMDSKRAREYGVDNNVEVRIYDIGKVVGGTIDYKSEEIDGKVMISVKIDQGISELSGSRKVNIDLVKNSYSGFKVPLKSLINVDTQNNKAKIVLVKANYARIKDVKIVGINDKYAVIDSLNNTGNISLYDNYVLNPENIQEGQIIKQ